MSCEVRLSTTRLEQLLLQPIAVFEARELRPEPNGSGSKRATELHVDHHFQASFKKRRAEFIDLMVETVTSDQVLRGLLNVVEFEHGDERERVVIVTTKKLDYHEPGKHISRVRLVLIGDGAYYIQVLSNVVEEGKVKSPEDFKELCRKVADSKMKFCPGIPPEEYAKYKEVIRYDLKGAKIVDAPIKRVASVKCRLWFPIGITASRERKKSAEILCRECVSLRCHLQSAVKRLKDVTPEVKVQHQQASSTYPMRCLSPDSLKKRKMNTKNLQQREKRMMKKFVPKEFLADSRQCGETDNLDPSLDDLASKELETILGEGEHQRAEIEQT